ncbi:hypothetical protein, partial [Phaeodactylibacter xiamenensis]|uniref:hypothetical protein n=1 Tax=Phaeodactylibacter xiamenensis TaxID=1524460 RepID=UPI0024A8DAD0
MMSNTLYLPINSGSLSHYFGSAIILPSKYYSNKQDDIQSVQSDAILLSNNKWVENSDCSLEVVLTETERSSLIKGSEYFFYCSTPIPISRVKSVCFLEEEQKATTIWNINNGAGFVPESIVSVEDKNKIEPIPLSAITTAENSDTAENFSKEIKQFNIILGGLGFMRLGGKPFMNYSPNYFSTLAHFNRLIAEQLNEISEEQGLEFSDKYTYLFSKTESEWTKWRPYIFENLFPDDIESLAEKEGESLKKKLGIIQIDSINPDTHLYDLAILATYGDKKSKGTHDLIQDLTDGKIYPDKSEDVAILFGLNNGYSRLRNEYKVGEGEVYQVKFSLDSKLDYYTIESVFQFIFHNRKDSYSFDYLDDWCPEKEPVTVKEYEVYHILDTTVIAKKKATPLEYFLERYSESIYVAFVDSIRKWLYPFATIDEEKVIAHLEKQLVKPFTDAVEGLKKRMQREFEYEQEAIITEHNKKVEELLAEIEQLKEDNAKLKEYKQQALVTEEDAIEKVEEPLVEIGEEGRGLEEDSESPSATDEEDPKKK